jgi:ABC-2 type transport system ATP-binding protein/lipopolysaccharide transport system ATP-binding protein
MYMRLGFSLAIHTEPDVLLVDEVLAVGDASFVAKCKERLAELRKAKTTLLLVTHDLDAVERWCDEVIWLNRGVVMDRGEPRRVIDKYRTYIEHEAEEDLKAEAIKAEPAPQVNQDNPVASERWGSREVEVTGVRLLDSSGAEKLLYHPDDAVKIEISYTCNETVSDLVFGVAFHRADGLLMHGSNTDIERVVVSPKSRGKVVYSASRIGFYEGQYMVDVAAHRQDGYPFDYRRSIQRFTVRSPYPQVGVCVPEHSWSFEG